MAEKYFVNEEILEVLCTAILNKTNERIAQRIVAQVDKNDRSHAPSGAAVFDFVSALGHANIASVTGDLPTKPTENTVYFRRATEADQVWSINAYIGGVWINNFGQTSVDVSNFYSKNDLETLKTDLNLANFWTKDNIDEMKAALDVEPLTPLSQEQIENAVNAAFEATRPAI